MTHSDLFDAEKYLFAEFSMGSDAEAFLESEIGRYVLGIAQQEIQENVNKLLDENVHFCKDESVKRAQRARDAIQWLLSAVSAGQEAERKLRDLDAEEGV